MDDVPYTDNIQQNSNSLTNNKQQSFDYSSRLNYIWISNYIDKRIYQLQSKLLVIIVIIAVVFFLVIICLQGLHFFFRNNHRFRKENDLLY